VRIGIDVGGTFTDVVVEGDHAGEIRDSFKVPTDVEHPLRPVMRRLRERSPEVLSELEEIVHGTTVATNALLENKLARVALVTTKGFRDVIEIARQNRANLYEVVRPVRPAPLVPRAQRFEISERMSSTGDVVTELDREELRALVKDFAADDYESVAVAFLNAYVDDSNELVAEEWLREVTPYVSISSAVDGQIGEYERTVTAVANAGLAPLTSRYLRECGADLSDAADDAGHPPPLFIMTSNGGFAKPDDIRARPATALMSGPAGGVAAARLQAEVEAEALAVTFDMGGTSTDVALIQDGRPSLSDVILGVEYPIRHPSVAIETVGAGGGSLAWVEDETGALKVGPASAGAVPGPACYGRGGVQATVCDALVVLGYLPSQLTLGGEISLDHTAAVRSLETLGARYSWNAVEAALAVFQVANVQMAEAIRLVSTKRGVDIRDAALYAYGGAGPMHAFALGQDLGFRSVTIPPFSSAFSALGCLRSRLRLDGVASISARVEDVTTVMLGERIRQTAHRLGVGVDGTGAGLEGWTATVHVDLKYATQNLAISVPVEVGDVSPEALAREFSSRHHAANGYTTDEQIVATSVRCTFERPGEDGPRAEQTSDEPAAWPAATPVDVTSAYFTAGEATVTSIHDRDAARGHGVVGPAIITDAWSTTVVGPSQSARVHPSGAIVLT
jgi:N-methylhydantoinase A